MGIDVNSSKLNDTGLNSSLANFSYVYKIQLSNYTFFLPGITVGLGSSRVNIENLVFGGPAKYHQLVLLVQSLLIRSHRSLAV